VPPPPPPPVSQRQQPPARKAGLEIRSREEVERERAEAAEATEAAEAAAAAAAEKEKEDALVLHEAEEKAKHGDTHEAVAAASEGADAFAPAAGQEQEHAPAPGHASTPPADAAPAVPGFGAAMTMEQYRAMAAQKMYMQGTVHATPKVGAEAASETTTLNPLP